MIAIINVFTTNHSNYAADGIMTMDAQSHLDFMARSMLQFNHAIFRQMPKEYNMSIDRDVFLSSFSLHQGDQTLRPRAWELGPDGSVHRDPVSVSDRDAACEEYLTQFYPHVARGIPSVSNEVPVPGCMKIRP